MRTARTVVCTLRLLSAAATLAAPLSVLGLGATIVACDDENDPKTSVKHLDDPAQRATAIKRLTQFYEDGMTKAGNDAGAPEIKSLLDTIVDPLTKTYTAGGLDEKTRIDLMKFLAETHDPRTQPAIAKALKEFEIGKPDDETRVACDSVNAMAKAGVKLDQTVIDELWNVFSRLQISKYTASPKASERLVRGLHDAIVAVHDPSYGDKAIDKLTKTVTAKPDGSLDVDSQRDQIQWWQQTSIQVISELRYTKAIKQLVLVLLTPTKIDLNALTRTTLLKMAPQAEPELIKAFKGQDADYAKAGEAFKDKTNLAILADTLALLSRPAGRDAILSAIGTADTDTTKTAFAQALVQFPEDSRVEPAFLASYNKLKWDASVELLGALKPRAALAQAAANFYDPNLVDWLLKEIDKAPDAPSKLLIWESAVKLMPPARKADVGRAFDKVKGGLESQVATTTKQYFDYASQALDKCGTNKGCYVALLDDPIPSTPSTANFKATKAAWMAVVYGGEGAAGDATRADLLKKVDKVRDASARLSLVEAIDELAPKGDVAAADALDKIVASDQKAGDKNVLMADDSVVKIALRLRARAAP
jgi:hypothetical protein